MKIKKIVLFSGVLMLASSQAYSHGYVSSPASRALLCKDGKNFDCGNRARYEPQSIEQVDQAFDLGFIDNNMGSAEVSGFEPLDEQEQSRWAKTVVRPGQPLDIRWSFTANHKSKHFKFYITKEGWNPNKLLTRADFENTPLNCYNPQPAWVAPNQPSASGLTYTCTMPARSGYQIIMAEWDVDDTRMSFYNLLDLDFTSDKPAGTIIETNGNTTAPSEQDDTSSDQDTQNTGNQDQTDQENNSQNNNESTEEVSASGIPFYDETKQYPTTNTKVVYEGNVYSSKWWVNPGEKPDPNRLYGPWKLIGKVQQEDNTSSDGSEVQKDYPVEATKFNINPMNVKSGDIISISMFSNGVEQEYELMTVPQGLTPADLFMQVAEKINELSVDKLDNNIIAGVKNSYGIVSPSTYEVYVYQTANKPYSQVTIEHSIANHNIHNQLHLMDFQPEYKLAQDGSLYIDANIMSHSSLESQVAVTLQDEQGNLVDRVSDIKISPMQTYNLNWKVLDANPGNYKLIVSSEIAGAQAWQKAMDIKVTANDSSAGNQTDEQEDTPAPSPEVSDNIVNVTIESNTPYYQVNADDTVTARSWVANIGEVNFKDNQIVIIPWNKAVKSVGNNSSEYMACVKPTSNATNITYVIQGNLNSLSCKIK